VSKVESKAKSESKPKPRHAPGPEFGKMLKRPELSTCPKCEKKRYVTEPGMKGTKHCPDCGHWEGLEEWTKKHEEGT